MAESQAFDLVCDQLEAGTSLDRLAARGTVRLTLKKAGLEARSITPEQMAVVVSRVLPEELASRGIEGASSLCDSIHAALQSVDAGELDETPDAVFRRLGGIAPAS